MFLCTCLDSQAKRGAGLSQVTGRTVPSRVGPCARVHADRWLVNFAPVEAVPSPFHVTCKWCFFIGGVRVKVTAGQLADVGWIRSAIGRSQFCNVPSTV